MKNLSIDDISSMVESTLNIINDSKKDKSDYTAEAEYLLVFIESFISGVLNLKLSPKLTRKEKFKIIKRNFENAKYGVEEAVAIAFQEALYKLSKTPIEYICKIKPIADNKSNAVH